jgi:hypothetical protein
MVVGGHRSGNMRMPDLDSGRKCIDLLSAEGFDVHANESLEWIHDTLVDVLGRVHIRHGRLGGMGVHRNFQAVAS